jgi:RNA polymerase sigma factor (sigma-70 family)
MTEEQENGSREKSTLMGAETPPTTWQFAEAVILDSSQRDKLLRYASSRFGIGREDAEDLLQDTLLEVLRKRAPVRSPEGFVFTLFRDTCARHVVARSRRREVFSEASESAEALPHAGGPEKIERRLALRQALAGISSACRQLLCAFYIEGQSLREAAGPLAVTEFGVSKTIDRCLRRLRACLN